MLVRLPDRANEAFGSLFRRKHPIGLVLAGGRIYWSRSGTKLKAGASRFAVGCGRNFQLFRCHKSWRWNQKPSRFGFVERANLFVEDDLNVASGRAFENKPNATESSFQGMFAEIPGFG
jgi:hypothetical protein